MLSAGGRCWPCIAGAGKPQELLDWHRRARRPNPEVFLQASRGSERLQNLARDVAKLKFDPDPSFLCLLLPLNKRKCKIRAKSGSAGCPETEGSVLSEVNGEGLW